MQQCDLSILYYITMYDINDLSNVNNSEAKGYTSQYIFIKYSIV